VYLKTIIKIEKIKYMLFEQFNGLVKEQFEKMCSTGKLFTSSLSGDTLWDLYLSSFKPEDNPVFRDPNSTSYDCNNDKHFIRHYGNIVALDDANNLITMWDVNVEGTEFELSVQSMNKELKKASINNVYYAHYNELNFLPYEKTNTTLYQLGHIKSTKRYTQEEVDKFGVVNTTDVYTFHHFHVYLPKQFVIFNDKSIAANLGELKTSHTLFLKGLQIPLDTLEVIRDLMLQGSLLRAELYLDKVKEFINIKQEYEALTSNKLNWAWKKFQDIPFARFANELIGTTCIELAEGKDINEVCKAFNKRVDPANYNKATAPITQRQIDNAAQRIEELGYTESFARRFATLEDIDINEILHTNISEKESTKVGNKTAALFSKVKGVSTGLSRHKRAEFDAVDEVTIEQFMSDILPNSSAIHVLVENVFENNFLALTTTNDKECKPLFKWSNPYSYTYNNNLAGKSFIKEAVKDAGGNTGGVLRGSLIWNESGTDTSDLDAWLIQPDGQQIGYNKGFRKDNGNRFSSCNGQLDLDNQNPGTKLGVENIYFQSLDKLKYGTYKFWVNQFSARNSQGFKYEIEFNGEVYNYEYNQPVRGNVDIATVAWDGKQFTVTHYLQPTAAKSTTIWNIDTNQFHKVNLVCLSPNYWGENAVGNKHFFFMLEGCKPTEPLRSFHIENLNGELLSERKVLEVLGATTMLEPIDKQLAGIGFTKDSTETLIVRVEGSFKRTVRIKF
jgi:hypothetical protein